MKLQKNTGCRENYRILSIMLTIIFPILLLTTLFTAGPAQAISSEHNPYLEIDINSWLQEEDLLEVYQIDETVILREPITPPKESKHKKSWTLILYLAADNDLGPFAVRNIKQMANIGSTNSINILIHLDIKTVGKKKVTRRFYVEKNKLIQLNIDDPITQKMDSGDPQTLISCFKWAVNDFPAYNYGLILWDHGTGPLDPVVGRIYNANELFTYNSTTNKLELDRSIGFLEYISVIERFSKLEQRGVCWDDSTGNYLTNQKLDFALKTICNECLHGNKITLLGFDACLMNTIEIASMVKKYAHLMVGSQEVVLGSGWNYQKVLDPFLRTTLNPISFAEHIVYAYDKTYHAITNDYTQAAIKLEEIEILEKNVNIIALLLIESLKKQQNGTVKKAIQASRNKRSCTHFDEPSYIDLHHFITNLQKNLEQFKLSNAQEEQKIKNELRRIIEETKKIIHSLVIANRVGSNLKDARGLSIYFPEQRIHSSYKKTLFAATNSWLSFLTIYLLS